MHPHSPLCRLAAEAALATAAPQPQPSRELAALQSLFKQAVEENRSLMEQLQAARARIAELEAAAAQRYTPAPPPPQPQPDLIAASRPPPQPQLLPNPRFPAVHVQPATAPPAGSPPAGAAAGERMACVKRALGAQLAQTREQPSHAEAPAPASEPLPPLPPRSQQQPQPEEEAPHHTSISLQVTAPVPAPPSEPAPAASDLQRVFSELQSLQRRLQAAEQRLALQGPPPAAHEPAPAAAPRQPSPAARASSRPGSAAGARPASRGGAASPGGYREHRDSWQLIRELKQRRAQLEAQRVAAAGAALASAALSPPAAGQPALGARAAAWLFDTQDRPPADAVLQQPRPRQAAAARPSSSGARWAGQRAGVPGAASAGRRTGREQSPMAWHAAGQPLFASEGGGGARGRRASLSAVSGVVLRWLSVLQWPGWPIALLLCHCAPPPPALQDPRSASRDRRYLPQQASAPRRRSLSRSQRDELDRLLMAGRPTTLLFSEEGAGGAAGGRGGARGGASTAKGDWVSPLVLA